MIAIVATGNVIDSPHQNDHRNGWPHSCFVLRGAKFRLSLLNRFMQSVGLSVTNDTTFWTPTFYLLINANKLTSSSAPAYPRSIRVVVNGPL